MLRRYLAALVAALAPIVWSNANAPIAHAEPQLSMPDACSRITQSQLPGAMILSATTVAAGTFVPPGGGNAQANARFASLPSFCRVRATLTPTADSTIGTEVWLPGSGWNGRFQAVGGRALGGIIVYPAMADALVAGYATASTDTGHVGPGGAFGLGHPEKVTDHGYRAVHEMTVFAKTVIGSFYDRSADRSYFNGCSLGGRQALAEIQRYPADYDGVITGDIANDITGLYAARLTQHQFSRRSAQSALTPAALGALNAAAVKACDRLDGVSDGVIENPLQCRFDPGSVACGAPGAPADCLNAEQVETARFLYAPVTRPDTGAVVSNGLMPGSEAGWTAILGPEPERNSVEVYRYIVFRNAGWDWHAFDLRSALAAAPASQLKDIDATDPNLRAYVARGGKLLMTHGWADPQTPPLNGIDYYTRARAAVGEREADPSIRLFMVPGMGHCSGGVGTDDFDAMVPLSEWVERGRAPERVDARRLVGGEVVRTRPLCAYPNVAHWNGTGDTNLASSFSCAAP